MSAEDRGGTEKSATHVFGRERRTVLRWLIRGFLSLWALGAAALGLSFLKAPSSEHRAGRGRIRCGSLSTLAIGEARFIRHGTDPLFVLRISEDEVIGLSAICTHLRCVLDWDRSTATFVCPCHRGSFDRTGNVLSGLPSRPLDRLRAEVRADEIIVQS